MYRLTVFGFPTSASSPLFLKVLVLGFGAALLMGSSPAHSQNIWLTGNWSETVNASDLVASAGTDLVSSCESTTGQVSVDVTDTAGSTDAWRIDISRSDNSWPLGLQLSVRRTSNGSGLGSVAGGTSYLSVTSSPNTLFNGAGDRFGVTVQLRLEGLSVGISPDVYLTSVVFTVIDV